MPRFITTPGSGRPDMSSCFQCPSGFLQTAVLPLDQQGPGDVSQVRHQRRAGITFMDCYIDGSNVHSLWEQCSHDVTSNADAHMSFTEPELDQFVSSSGFSPSPTEGNHTGQRLVHNQPREGSRLKRPGPLFSATNLQTGDHVPHGPGVAVPLPTDTMKKKSTSHAPPAKAIFQARVPQQE